MNNPSNQSSIPQDRIRKILVIRRNRMGDMLCTLPLLRALRGKFPSAVIKVACETMGEPIVRACSAVDEVVVLKKGLNRWHTLLLNLKNLRGCDLAIGVKAGYDRHLAAMTWWSGAKYRIGFFPGKKSFYYNYPLPVPPRSEYQIDKCLRLLEALGGVTAAIDLHLDLPSGALEFAERVAIEKGFSERRLAVFNLSSNRASWSVENFSETGRRVLDRTGGVIALSCLPPDQQRAEEIIRKINSPDVFIFRSPTPIELAAVLKRAELLITTEGGISHLAAAVGAPAIVLWPKGTPFHKWQSYSSRHFHLRATTTMDTISVSDVWDIIEREFLLRAAL